MKRKELIFTKNKGKGLLRFVFLLMFLWATPALYAQLGDSDGDGIPDHIDLDKDNDGILDAVEGCVIPGVLPDVAGEINSGTDYKVNSSGVRTHNPNNASNTGQTNDGSTTIDAASGLLGQVTAVDGATNISVDYTITRESEHNGFGATRYSRNQDNGIFLVATHDYPSGGANGTVYEENDTLSYKIALNNVTFGYQSRVTIRQNIFCARSNNEAADWVFTWDGGGSAVYYDDAIDTTAATVEAGGDLNPNGVLYPHGYPASGFDVNEREIVGLDTIGSFTSGGGFRAYFASNKTTKWRVVFPPGATNIKAVKVILTGGVANGLSDNPADGVGSSFPKFGRIGVGTPDTVYYNGDGFSEFLTYQIDFIKDTDNDGVANCLDLDSDNDGCSDAQEGGANLTANLTTASGTLTDGNGNVVTQNLGNTVDANPTSTSYGVPTVAGAGQTVGVSQDASKNDCADLDGDGVPNYADLDNDNDGILDTDEGVNCNSNPAYHDGSTPARSDFTTTSTGSLKEQLLFFNLSGITGAQFDASGTTPIERTVTFNNVTYKMVIKNGHGRKSGVAFGASNAQNCLTQFYNLGNAFPERLLLYADKGVSAGYVVELTATHSNGTTLPVEVFVSDAQESDVATENVKYHTNGSPFQVIESNGTLSNVLTGVGTQTVQYLNTFTASGNGATLRTKGDTSVNITVDYLVPTSSASTYGPMGVALAFIIPCDYDNDGLPNYLDTDSDNDGCSDANEYYNLPNADADGNGMYGSGTPTVDSVGKVTGASYTGSYTSVTDSVGTANITTNPVNTNSALGQDTIFTVVIDNNANAVLQWQESTDNGATWSDVVNGGFYGGATNDTLTLTGITATLDSNLYRVIVTQSNLVCTADTSANGMLLINFAPVANTDNVTVVEDTTNVYIDVQANDTDADGDDLTTTVVSGPTSGGTATVVGGDSIVYNPPANFNGADTIIYQICDNGTPVLCDTDTVFITVTPVNDAPTGGNETMTVTEDDPATNSPNVLANNTDAEGDSMAVTVIDQGNGTATFNSSDSTIIYTPNADFCGEDTVLYNVCDPSNACVQDTLFVTVTCVNDAPVANTDNVTVTEDTTNVYIDVQANDTDVEGDDLTTTIVSGPTSGGTATVVGGDSIVYNPPANFNGSDTIIYQICDNGTPVLCDTDTVFITVTPVNDAPTGGNETMTVTEDDSATSSPNVLANNSDADGDDLTVTITDQGNGTATFDPSDSTIIYTPNADFCGEDTVLYNVCDNGTPVECVQDTLFVTVTCVNDAPEANTDTITVTEGATDVYIDVQANDTDAEGGNLTTTIISGPTSGGTVTVVNGDSIVYNPPAGFTGVDTIIYQICDDGNPVMCDTDTVFITVVMDCPSPTDTDGDGLTDCEEATGIDDPSTSAVPNGISNPNDPCDPFTCDVVIPEGITPDGDGINDVFVIERIERFPNNTFSVYNRWGNLVYQVEDYQNDWTGITNEGIQVTGNNELPTGTYFYLFDTKDKSKGKNGVIQGYIFIKR